MLHLLANAGTGTAKTMPQSRRHLSNYEWADDGLMTNVGMGRTGRQRE